MEQVTIMSDKPRMSLRERKELIERVLGHGKGSTGMEPSKDLDNAILPYLGWRA